MKFKLFTFLLLGFLLLSKASIAAQVEGWSISSSNIVGGKLFLNSTGATSVSFDIQYYHSNGETNVNIQFALATKKSDGTVQLLSSVNSIGDSDFPSDDLYGDKTITVAISNSSVINQTVYLVTDVTGGTNYTFSAGPYSVTNTTGTSGGSSGGSSGGCPTNPTLSWTSSHSFAYDYVNASTVTGTYFHTSPNAILTSGQSLVSASGATKLVLQTDGNLVLYQVSTGKALWATSTNSGTALYFQQSDGNLVLKNSSLSVVWSSNIFANGGNTCNAQYAFYVLQDDGNLVMMTSAYYSGTGDDTQDWILGDTGTPGFVKSSHMTKIQ